MLAFEIDRPHPLDRRPPPMQEDSSVPTPNEPISGTCQQLLFSPKGFPHGMAQIGLGVGAMITAVGELRMTVLGTRMLEARAVNRVELG